MSGQLGADAPSAAPRVPRSVTVAALAATFLTQTVAAASMIGPTVIAPVAAPLLGIPAERIGWFVAVAYLFAMFSGLGCAALVLRIGGLKVCQIALVLAGVGLLLASAGRSGLLALGASLIGIGYGWVNPATSHLLVERTPRPVLGLVLSIKQTGVPAGGALAGAVLPVLMLVAGWRWSAAALGALCLGAALSLAAASGIEQPGPRVEGPRSVRFSLAKYARPLRMVFRSRRLSLLAVSSLAYASLQLNLNTYLVSYLHMRLALSLVVAGLVFSTTQVAGLCGRIAWGAVADHMREPLTLMGLLGVAGGGCAVALAFGASWPLWALVLLCATFGATSVGWNGLYFALVARAAPDGEESTITGGMQFVTFFGALAAPPLFGFAIALSGSYGLAFAAFGAVSIVIGAVLMRAPGHAE